AVLGDDISLTVHTMEASHSNFGKSKNNTPPAAVSDGYTICQNTQLNVSATGVLANDTDADHNTLTAVLVGGAANGGVVLNSDGSFTYTPNTGFSGTDTFTYKANDGTADSNVVTVTITVNSTPAVTTNPSNATVCAGAQASFTAGASGTPTPNVQWQVSTDNGATFNN